MFFYPKHLTYPVREEVTLTIEPHGPVTVSSSNEYTISILPFSGLRRYGLRNTGYAPGEKEAAFFQKTHLLFCAEDRLSMQVVFPQEDCYLCEVFINGETAEKFEIYALENDLFCLQPYKGDNHLHSWMSDGKDSPMYMAAASCRRGYDYCVITDHRYFEPSLIAKNFFEKTGVDFLIIPGEEVHSPNNKVHIINMGGDESVNDWWRNCEPEYRAAVEEELKNMHAPMSEKDRYSAAASQVIFDRIRAVNGVSILCHPCWIRPYGFSQTEDVTDYLFDHKRFDALELIAGGAYEMGTQMQLSYYNARETMPILGNSDAHACFGDKLEPGNYTIIFADALTANALKDSICNGMTVAGNEKKLYGEYRLVKYAYFLMRNFYPEHSGQRDLLGAQMLRYASSMGEAECDLVSVKPSELFATRRYSCEENKA